MSPCTAQSIDDEAFVRLARKLEPGSTLLRAWELKGGVSAQVTALEIERPDGRTQKMIVRRHGAVDVTRNPQIAADEFKLLQLLHGLGLAVPAPYYLDRSGEIFATPCIVVEYVEGEPDFAPAELADHLREMATQLARIHNAGHSNADLSFLPEQEELVGAKLRARPAQVDESLDEGRIRDTLEAVWPLPRRNRPVLLHGDFWPGNLLWKGGRLAAVVDWEDAAVGDPLADLANSRLEILWAFGVDAMHRFTRHYASTTAVDLTHLPYWDLCAALRPAGRLAEWAGGEAAEKRMRDGHRYFVAQAFATL